MLSARAVQQRHFIFNAAVIEFIKATGTKPVRTSFRSPWQNGTAERWVGSCRRELLEHVVVLGACHLIRLVRAYISYYHEDRCHLGLNKDTPSWRCCTARSKSLTSLCRLQSHPAQYVSGIPSAAILLSISHPIRCSTRCLANVRARISGPMIAL